MVLLITTQKRRFSSYINHTHSTRASGSGSLTNRRKSAKPSQSTSGWREDRRASRESDEPFLLNTVAAAAVAERRGEGEEGGLYIWGGISKQVPGEGGVRRGSAGCDEWTNA